MTTPAYIEWVWMTKLGEEDKLVHPGNVEAHRRAGWLIKSNPPGGPSPIETENASTLPEEMVNELPAKSRARAKRKEK